MYKLILRPLLFLLEPERAHEFSFFIIKKLTGIRFIRWILKSFFSAGHPLLKKTVFGIEFPNPVGLAAGFDKDAALLPELQLFGFGFIEIGTLTPMPQPGNDKPRMFRLPEDGALVNRMGFNNKGVEPAAAKLHNRPAGLIVGGNIGKNKITPNENALSDYIFCFNALFDSVDYFVVNVSSPNTPGLRALQEKGPLREILGKLMELNNLRPKPKPILLKIAPDLSDSQLDDVIEIVNETRIHGLVATNTTISRDGLKISQPEQDSIGTGGLSGKPLTRRSTEVIAYLVKKSDNKIPVIAAGGIFTPEDAIEKLEAGAALIQVYTGFIYEGPSMVKSINKKLIKYYERKKAD